MTTEHPITPPTELVKDWIQRYGNSEAPRWQTYEEDIATQAARWGADTELEACEKWLSARTGFMDAHDLHSARRPKPPSLKEQALETLRQIPIDPEAGIGSFDLDIIRRALETLPDA